MTNLRIAIIFFLAVLVSGCGAGNADTHAKKFMELLKDGKHLAVQEYLSTEMKQMVVLLGGVTDQSLNQYYRKGRMVSYSLTATERAEKAVRYKVVVTCIDGKKYEDILDIRIENGKWRVAKF